MNFPGGGYYRGNLDALVKDSIRAFDALPPEKQAEIREAQRQSWVRGEMGIGLDKQEQTAREEYRNAQSLQPAPSGGEIRSEVPAPSAPATGETLIQGEGNQARAQAVGMGYTGDQCSTCNSMRMKIAGHCMVCEDCGTTTGCS